MKHIRGRLLCWLSMLLLAACGGGEGSSAPQIPMTVVTVTPAMANVMVGQQIQLGATTTDAMGNVLTGDVVTWASSNAAVATVSSTGLVMALALGKATITATSDGQSGTAALTTTTGLVFAMVSAGSRHTCGLTPGGVAYCWGDNSSGQLGNGTTTNSATPVPVSGALSFATVSAGGNHTCGATSALVTYCWGDNSSGQLGNGTTTNSAMPVVVAGGLIFTALSAGGRHTCGVSFTVYCWGDNSSGQLGNGTLTNSSVPVAAMLQSTQSSETKSAAGSNHTCAIDRVGGFIGILDVFCWGDNSSGQLGNGTMTNSAVPVSATGAFEAVLLSAGTLYTCALGVFSAAPNLSCWGNNGAGQLGNGTTTNSARGVLLSGALIFASMSAGALHVCGPVNSSANGTVFSHAYCWGGNSSGQLGNGTTTNSAMPIVVAGGLNFTVVSAGGRHTCGVIGIASNPPSSPPAAGAVYCWGDNTFGQLGNSWTTSSPVPVNVAGQL